MLYLLPCVCMYVACYMLYFIYVHVLLLIEFIPQGLNVKQGNLTDTQTDTHEYSIVAVDKPQL